MAEKTALVLSAGGMFGAYQAGVWRSLAGRFRPDMVIGTSAGALNAWAIAGGCGPDELIGHWRDPAIAGFLKQSAPKRLWQGFFDPTALNIRVQRMCSLYTPRLPVGVVLTDMVRLRSRLVITPGIRAEHLAAACSFPLGFPPVRIGGRLYLDGGVMSILPLWAAKEMGATQVVAVNVLPAQPSRTLRVLVRILRAMRPERKSAAGLSLTIVAPAKPLGTLRECLRWDPACIDRWVELGEKDARSITISLLCPSTGSTA